MKVSKLCVALLVSLSSACSLHQSDPTGFVPMTESPQPGYTSLSDYFGVEIEGGVFTARRIMFFYLGGEKQSKELIGSDFFPVYASRQGAYALSKDGKTLLLMHSNKLNKDKLKKETGLYEYTDGIGEKLLDTNARSGIYINETLPANAIVFKRKNCPDDYCFDSPTIVRFTDGSEYVWKHQPNMPLDPRR